MEKVEIFPLKIGKISTLPTFLKLGVKKIGGKKKVGVKKSEDKKIGDKKMWG